MSSAVTYTFRIAAVPSGVVSSSNSSSTGCSSARMSMSTADTTVWDNAADDQTARQTYENKAVDSPTTLKFT